MDQVRSALGRAASVLLLAAAAACADGQPAVPRTTPDTAPSPALSVRGRSPRDLPEVKIDLPAKARAWDDDPAALAAAVAEGEGYAVVAFKETGSARALETGRRGAVTAGTVRAGIQLLERHGAEVLDLLDGIGGARVRISPQAAAEISRHPLVDFVEPRQYGRVQAQTTPAGVTLVQAPDFWTATGYTGAGAKVEIIDTGWQPGHPDLPAVPAGNCNGFFGGCDDSATSNWHGTHVFGIIAARNNGDGMVGVAPGLAASDVYVYGACSNTGSCPTDQVTAGINAGIWNVDVMNLSLVQPFDLAQATAVGQAWSDGIVLVAAAGNNLTNTLTYPASYANVVGVSGVLADKGFASTSVCGNYSNQGTHVDLAAPFEAYSTMGTDTYGTQCGTSMAAAHVTGVAALVKSKNPTWTNQQIVDSLYAWAEDLGTAGKDNQFGHGLVRPGRVEPVTALVSGPSTVTTAGSHTWTALPGGGNGAFAYAWEHRVHGTTTWTQVATTPSYTRNVTSADPSFELRATVTSAGLAASDTQLVTVSVTAPPVPVIAGPTSVTGAGTQTWTTSVTGGNGTNSYNWEYRTLGGTWSSVGTAASYSRSVTPGSASFELRVTVTSGGMTGSDTHVVSVAPTASISGSTSISTSGTHTWSASAAGGSGTYTYQWEYRTQGASTWTAVGTASSYSRSVAPGAASFELRLTVTSGGLTGSDTHAVAVAPTANISGTASITAAGTYTWQSNPAGGNGTYTYVWEYRTQGASTWTQVGTAASYARSVATSNADFELRVTVTSAGLTDADTHLVAVTAPPTASISGATYITTTSTYTWQANAAAGNGVYTYAWAYRPQGSSTWTQVGTGGSYSRSVSNLDPDFELRVTVTSAGLTGTDVQLVTVTPPPPTANITGPNSTYAAQGTTFQANAGGGNGTYTYQWQFRLATTTTWTNVGTGGSSYTRTAPNGDFYVRVTVTSAGASVSDDHFVNVCNPLC